MIEKKTANRNYPKPDANNFLQDDVKNIENALDLIDQDIHELKQEQTVQNNELETKADISALESAVSEITGTKADKSALESAVNDINNTKAEKSDVENKLEEMKLAIEGKIAIESLIEFSI